MCLGYFDSIHKGHIEIIKKAKEYSNLNNILLGVIIFTGGKNNSLDVFSLEERLVKLKLLNVDFVVYNELSQAFMKKTHKEFLDELFNLYNIDCVITGEDFTFGAKAFGNVKFLKKYCDDIGVKTITLPKVLCNKGNKISTKTIKNALLSGDIKLANELLGSNYFIRGRIVKGKKLGSKLGFPTANILIDKSKLKILEGVYLTLTIINDKLYPCLTNVGKQPTVNGESFVVETYIDGFSGDIYDKIISVYFIEKIRDIIKFNNVDELKNQLNEDLRWLK